VVSQIARTINPEPIAMGDAIPKVPDKFEMWCSINTPFFVHKSRA
jgi:hypothetical protein